MFKKLFHHIAHHTLLIAIFLTALFFILNSSSSVLAADECSPGSEQFVGCRLDPKSCTANPAFPRTQTFRPCVVVAGADNKWGAETIKCVANDACPAEISEIENIFSNVLGIVAALAALGAFIMLIVGGFKYMTSGGDPKATSSAKNTITYAIIGLILLIVAWLILLLIKAITGVDVTQFNIINNP